MHWYVYNIQSDCKSVLFKLDHDECGSDDTNNCVHNCYNSEFSYYCTCDDGYSLEEDGYSCSGN